MLKQYLNNMDFNHRNHSIERRQLIKGLSFGFGTTVLGSPFFTFNELRAAHQRDPATRGGKQDKKLGIALVGLGQYSAGQLAPALKETKHCYLAGIVTGTSSKIEPWKQEYNIPDKNVYSYDEFDKIADNPDIDIVYIVLPVSLHAEYTIRAAKAKKHVICEKPMAMNVEEAQQMLDACNENGVQLAIGYRLHFEPFNKRVMELGQNQLFGNVKSIEAKNTSDMTQGPTGPVEVEKRNGWRRTIDGYGYLLRAGRVLYLRKKPGSSNSKVWRNYQSYIFL